MKNGRNLFLVIFWLCASIDLYAVIIENESLHMAFKPTLMSALTVAILFTKGNKWKKGFIITALVFSLLGDIYLLFEKKDPLFFILGLGSFLLAHIFYIIFFLKLPGREKSLLKEKPWIIILIISYVSLLLFLILPSVGSLLIPVSIYALIICGMLLSTFHIYRRVNSGAAKLFIAGAVSFVFSDSLLAINKFYTSIGKAGLLIMLTYCIAQFLIVSGFIKLSTHQSQP